MLRSLTSDEGGGADKQASAAGCHYDGVQRDAEYGDGRYGVGILDDSADGGRLSQRMAPAHCQNRFGHIF